MAGFFKGTRLRGECLKLIFDMGNIGLYNSFNGCFNFETEDLCLIESVITFYSFCLLLFNLNIGADSVRLMGIMDPLRVLNDDVVKYIFSGPLLFDLVNVLVI